MLTLVVRLTLEARPAAMQKQGKEMTTTPANSFVAHARMCPGLRWVEEAQPQGELLNTLRYPHLCTTNTQTFFFYKHDRPNVFYNSTVMFRLPVFIATSHC